MPGPMKASVSLLAIAVTLTALAMTGCGDDSEDTVSKPTFVKQANEACASEKKKLRAEAGSVDEILERAIAVLQAQADAIESIGTPPGDEAEVDAMLAGVRRAITRAEGDDTIQTGKALAQAEKLAAAYGLEQCWISAS